MKFRMLFPAVLIYFSNSKVCQMEESCLSDNFVGNNFSTCMTSGAIQNGVPITVFLLAIVSWDILKANLFKAKISGKAKCAINVLANFLQLVDQQLQNLQALHVPLYLVKYFQL